MSLVAVLGDYVLLGGRVIMIMINLVDTVCLCGACLFICFFEFSDLCVCVALIQVDCAILTLSVTCAVDLLLLLLTFMFVIWVDLLISVVIVT